MFYHRILPPPSTLARSSATSLRPPKGDTLIENQIVMSENHKVNVVQRRDSRTQPGKSSITDLDLARPDEEEGRPIAHSTRSATRLYHKRDSSASSAEGETRRSSKAIQPPVSSEGSNGRNVESPSNICLCQPDPKVPRPRNGMKALHLFMTYACLVMLFGS